MSDLKSLMKLVELKNASQTSKRMIKSNPSLFFACLLAVLIIAVLYNIFVIQYLYSFDFNFETVVLNLFLVSGLIAFLISFFIRNKFKNEKYVTLFFNMETKAHNIVHAGIFIYYVTHTILLVLIALPFVILHNLQTGNFNTLLFSINLFLSISIAFYLSFNLWVIASKVIFSLSRNNDKDHLLSTTFVFSTLFIVSAFVIHYTLGNAMEFPYLYAVIASLFLIFNLYVVNCLSLYYLRYSFQTLVPIAYREKKVKISAQDNNLIKELKTELLSIKRNGVFKEQAIVFIILFITSIGLYVYLDIMRFDFFFSYLINFGLKEIILLISLEIGISFNSYKKAIYPKNLKKSVYLYIRILALLIINFLCFFLFITTISLITSSQVSFDWYLMISVVFVSLVSLFIGFALRITDSNKILVVLTLLIAVNLYDFFVLQILDPIWVSYLNICISVMLVFITEFLYLRRPVLR
ncbi:hypothetical protein KFZ58_00100 [Virgibacillus sp. NKC19-16]|uniref:hypothetical protein n=1 Tax=Virgibacillus salidurans TaxID=2831673 RepID=UPI001F2C2E4D|nr:hypothetical protein [Virgibacillus sp. NKC19-16]UJL46428.1 hypothetical protein KFZ58_00100 [Virgibacillus sp. NKC19-16]